MSTTIVHCSSRKKFGFLCLGQYSVFRGHKPDTLQVLDHRRGLGYTGGHRGNKIQAYVLQGRLPLERIVEVRLGVSCQ